MDAAWPRVGLAKPMLSVAQRTTVYHGLPTALGSRWRERCVTSSRSQARSPTPAQARARVNRPQGPP
eukprot:8880317-Pyramimonas_sp.AAC.1